MKHKKYSKAIYIVISILVAVFFWMYVDNTNANERDLRLYHVPISFVGAEDELADRGLMLVSGDDATIDLRLQGRRQVISRINKNNIKITVDVRDLTSTGTHTLEYRITYPSNVSSGSVTVVSASIYAVTVEVAELCSKTISVQADVQGAVPKGYMLHECALTPETLTISGTREAVDSVDHALVQITLNGATSSYSEYLTYQLMDAEGAVVTPAKLRCSDDKVRVEVPVVTVREIPLRVDFVEESGSMLSDITYTIVPESIMVSGEENILKQVETITVAQIQLSHVMGDDTLEYEIPLPSGCVNESGTDMAKVKIQFNQMQTKRYECEAVTFTNVPDGYTAMAVTQIVNVTLRGPQEELEEISSNQIRIVVDLADKSAASGAYTAKAKIYVDGVASSGAIGTYQISYQLKKS